MAKYLNIIKNIRYLKYTNKLLLFFSTALFIFGLIMIFSASNISAFMRYNKSPYYFLMRQGIFLGIGLLAFMVIISVETKNYKNWSWGLLLISMGLLFYTMLFGADINDSKGWIKLLWFSFQPSEIAKITIILWISTFFEIKRLAINRIGPSLIMFGIALGMAGCVVVGNDFGTAGIIVLITYLLYFLVPIRFQIKFNAIAVTGAIILIGLAGYYVFDTSSFTRQIARFSDFGEPCSEEKFYTGGNQVCNSEIAFNNGNITGKGLGNSTQKYLYLPESHTDFIFAIVVEETGLVGGGLVLLSYFIIIFTTIRTGAKANSFRGSMICYGIAIYIFLHIAINLGGISGLIPLTGVPLPFLSYGGTFTICLIVGLSLVQRVAIENNLEKNKK